MYKFLVQFIFIFALAFILFSSVVNAANPTTISSLKLVPTYESIGIYASFSGDDNSNNFASMEWRKVGDSTWKTGMEMVVDRRTGSSNLFTNQWRASIIGTQPNTEYEVRVTFSDSDGVSGTNPVSTTIRTKNDVIPLGTGKTYYVAISGSDTNPGTESQPFRTISKAVSVVAAGDTVYVKAGTYNEQVIILASGTANNYITFLPFGSDEVIIDGQGSLDSNINIGVNSIADRQGGNYVRVSGFKVRNAQHAGVNIGGDNVVVENMEIRDFNKADLQDQDHWVSGITINNWGTTNLTIRGNTIIRTIGSAGFSAPQGISIRNENLNMGGGYAIYNNQVFGNGGRIKDGIGGLPNFQVPGFVYRDSDIYDNYIEGVYDDGIESEGGNVNVRIWNNTIKSPITIGIGFAPTLIGPLYVFRNSIIDVSSGEKATFKLGENGVGKIYVYHNSIYMTGGANGPSGWGSGNRQKDVVFKNNIYYVSRYVYEYPAQPPYVFDYNLMYTTDTGRFAKWYNDNYYYDLASFRSGTGQEANGIYADPKYVSPAAGDLNLQSSSPAIDKGVIIVGFNDANSPWPYSGTAPDMGVYEYGAAPPSFNFNLAVSPGSGSVIQGQSTTATVTATLTAGTTQTVSFTYSTLPSGATVSFSQSSCNPTCSNTLTIATSSTTPAGTYSITITGTGGGLTRTATYSLTVSAPDTTPPLRSNGQPTGTLATGTTQTTVSLTTDEAATCRYATTAGIAYDSMTNTFSTTGGTIHSQLVTGLSNGNSYSYYVKCKDTAGNANTDNYLIQFSVAMPSAFDFSLSLNPTSGSATQGSSMTATVTANLVSGTTQSVSLSSSVSPIVANGPTVGFSPGSCSPTCSSTMTVSTSASTPTETYTITITGTAGSLTRTATYTLTVSSACVYSPGTISFSPSSTVAPGASVTASSDFGSVCSGKSLSLRRDTCTGASYGSCTVSAAGSCSVSFTPPSAGNYNLVFCEGSGSTQHSGTLTVSPLPSLNISFVDPTDPNNAVITRDWSYVKAAVVSANPIDTFLINWNGVDISTKGLVGLWHLNNDANDYSGYGNNGVMSGATSTSGRYGSAYSFDGVNNYINLGNPSSLSLSKSITIEAWVYIRSADQWDKIISKGDRSYGLELRTDTNKITLTIYDTTWRKADCGNLVYNQWLHVAGTFDGTTMRCYVNGVLGGTGTASNINTNTYNVYIGGNSQVSQYFNGSIDEVRIYDRALSSAEISAGYQTEFDKYYMNKTGLAVGSYSYYAWLNDTSGSWARTETRTLTVAAVDTTAPVRSNGQPTGTLSAGTTSTTISLTAIDSTPPVTCRYSTTPNTPYSSMTGVMTNTVGNTHSTTVTGLSNGNTYNYYVRCQDSIGNANINDFTITFSVSAPCTYSSGTITFSPTTVTPSASVTASSEFGSACSGKSLTLRRNSCTGTQYGSCTVTSAGSCSVSFTAPSTTGSYNLILCEGSTSTQHTGTLTVAVSYANLGSTFDQLTPVVVDGSNVEIRIPLQYVGSGMLDVSISKTWFSMNNIRINEAGTIITPTVNSTHISWQANLSRTAYLQFDVPAPNMANVVIRANTTFYQKNFTVSANNSFRDVSATVAINSSYRNWVLYWFNNSWTDATNLFRLSVTNSTASFYGFSTSDQLFRIEGSTEACIDADDDTYYSPIDCSVRNDCDDSNAAINPGAAEVCGNGIDENCDGIDTACPQPPSPPSAGGGGSGGGSYSSETVTPTATMVTPITEPVKEETIPPIAKIKGEVEVELITPDVVESGEYFNATVILKSPREQNVSLKIADKEEVVSLQANIEKQLTYEFLAPEATGSFTVVAEATDGGYSSDAKIIELDYKPLFFYVNKSINKGIVSVNILAKNYENDSRSDLEIIREGKSVFTYTFNGSKIYETDVDLKKAGEYKIVAKSFDANGLVDEDIRYVTVAKKMELKLILLIAGAAAVIFLAVIMFMRGGGGY